MSSKCSACGLHRGPHLCRDCKRQFTVTVDERTWYASKGWPVPQRCEECRKAARRARHYVAAAEQEG